MDSIARFVAIPVLASTALSSTLPWSAIAASAQDSPTVIAQAMPTPDAVVDCEIMIVGGGLAGTATAYESLLAGRTVCMTEITDWVGGQISSQGTTALDEYPMQRSLLYYPQGYIELRERVEARYGTLNPGECWVSVSCFMPDDANDILRDMLADAEAKGGGELKWFPNTVVKEVSLNGPGNQITSLVAIQHSPAPGTAPLNSDRLSQIIDDAYTYEDSARLTKTVIQFIPIEVEAGAGAASVPRPADWYVVEATETGELIALADVPYQLGLDPRSHLNPSSPVTERDPYCTQGYTYTFAMQRTADRQTYDVPDFYETYAPYYSWDEGRDYLETAEDWSNFFILTHDQLITAGQLAPGGWMGGLRTEALRKGEEMAMGYFYWLVLGDSNAIRDDSLKDPDPYHLYLQGLDSPMGTEHGLSKYPYIREGRRIIGRPAPGYRSGFQMNEVDISWKDYSEDSYYRETLDPETYRRLRLELARQDATAAIAEDTPAGEISQRTRARIFPDSVGIAQYAIDFHPCMVDTPVEKLGNIERPGVRQAHGPAYPGQIPLRALIPQQIDNLLVAGKSIAASYIVTASYRVHSFEWAVGTGAAHTLDFALRNGVMPYELVDNLPNRDPQLEQLQAEIAASGNPVSFPNTSIFNTDWDEWNPGW